MNILRNAFFKKLLVLMTSILLMTGSDALASSSRDEIKVFAAASLTNSINELGDIFLKNKNIKVVPSFAASSTLAKQIENGAPVDVFISADLQWMDYLDGKKLLMDGSRFNLLGNRLVLIAPESSRIVLTIGPGVDLTGYLRDGLLATGDPDHVPVGKYAKSALEKLGMWQFVSGKLARASDVRSALTWVEKGECPLGIVYETDAAVSKKVRVVSCFPDGSYPPIVYPAALVKTSRSSAAKDFLEFLKSEQAKNIFQKYGFTVK